MIHMAMMLASEQGSFEEEWAETVDTWHELLDTLKLFGSKQFLFGLTVIILYVVTWIFLTKTGLVDNKKKKAEKRGRTITADYIHDVPEAVFRGELDAGDIRMFHYSYTHPLTGKPEQYELDFCEKGAPPLQLTLYYTEGGKVFDAEKGNKSSPFWMAFGIIVPIIIGMLLLSVFGIEE